MRSTAAAFTSKIFKSCDQSFGKHMLLVAVNYILIDKTPENRGINRVFMVNKSGKLQHSTENKNMIV